MRGRGKERGDERMKGMRGEPQEHWEGGSLPGRTRQGFTKEARLYFSP